VSLDVSLAGGRRLPVTVAYFPTSRTAVARRVGFVTKVPSRALQVMHKRQILQLRWWVILISSLRGRGAARPAGRWQQLLRRTAQNLKAAFRASHPVQTAFSHMHSAPVGGSSRLDRIYVSAGGAPYAAGASILIHGHAVRSQDGGHDPDGTMTLRRNPWPRPEPGLVLVSSTPCLT
jgi:hypothetical protein